MTKSSNFFWRYLVMSEPVGRFGQIFVAISEYMSFIRSEYVLKKLFLPNNSWGKKQTKCNLFRAFIELANQIETWLSDISKKNTQIVFWHDCRFDFLLEKNHRHFSTHVFFGTFFLKALHNQEILTYSI